MSVNQSNPSWGITTWTSSATSITKAHQDERWIGHSLHGPHKPVPFSFSCPCWLKPNLRRLLYHLMHNTASSSGIRFYLGGLNLSSSTKTPVINLDVLYSGYNMLSVRVTQQEWEVLGYGSRCYIPFHSSDSDSFSDLILDSVTCHRYYASRIFSLSFLITFLLYLFTPVSDRKPDIGL